jgi:cob(I)alamin adenosyltransferase
VGTALPRRTSVDAAARASGAWRTLPRMRIYTRTGDDGSTGLHGGGRASKGSPRVEAFGEVDEANAAIGLARATALPPPVDAALERAQRALFTVGALLASPPGRAPGVSPVTEDDVSLLERAIDALEAGLTPLRTFVLPGGSEAAARLHVARTVCRRAERAVVRLSEAEPVDPILVRYLNRLSDLLFVQAREANRAQGRPDVPWTPGS